MGGVGVWLRHATVSISIWRGYENDETFQVLAELVYEPVQSRMRVAVHKKLFTFIELDVNAFN